MNFLEAMKALLNGQKVRQTNDPEGHFIHLGKDGDIEDHEGDYADLVDINKFPWELFKTPHETKIIELRERIYQLNRDLTQLQQRGASC